MTSSLRVIIDPEYATSITVRVQPYRYPYGDNPNEPTVGLGTVEIDGTSIASTDTTALRNLAAKLREAADMADAVTAEHRSEVSA